MTKSRPPDGDRIFTRMFFALMVSNACLRASTFMLVTLVPIYVIDRGFTPAEAGLTTTLYMGAAVLMRPTAGSLVDRRGRWVVMTIGAMVFTAASGLFVFALPLWLFLALRAAQGLGFSLNGTAAMTLATDILPQRKLAQGLGLLGLEQTVVQIFAPWLALQLRVSVGYTAAFAVVFAFGLLSLALRMPLASNAKRRDRDRLLLRRSMGTVAAPRRPMWHKVVDHNAWRASSVMFFFMFGATGVNSFLAAYTISRGIENAGIFFIASGVALAVSRVALVPLGRRFGQIWIIVPGIVTVSMSMLVVFWSPGLWQLAIAGALYGLGAGVVTPGLMTLAVLSAHHESRGLANSTFYMAMDLGNAIGALVLGVIATAYGLGSAFIAASAVIALAGVVLVAQWRAGWVSELD